MGQPFQPGPPPHNPAGFPGPGWGSPPGYPPPSGGRRAADAIAAAGLALAAILFVARRIWLFARYDKFFWSDAVVVLTVLFALFAAVLLLTAGRPAVARVAGGIGAGAVLAPNLGLIFSAGDRNLGSAALAHGGWLAIPTTLVALVVIGALFSAAMSTGGPRPPANSWPQPQMAPPPNAWQQQPMPGAQPPAGYPGQHQPPPPQWPQQ
ncbi:hypothetical protein BJY24_005322 [Nocardia transvalensis]|uniref:Uncharacterized protein n=1 Tax=Nocardia transvalensis TaxID=37333 RepID=A0A7W9UL75_9NOCA|nr:hypothetical protein [Nocardia transvalensis]MBB5916410.1 hypothetical protein [Nocardia transvalensis]